MYVYYGVVGGRRRRPSLIDITPGIRGRAVEPLSGSAAAVVTTQNPLMGSNGALWFFTHLPPARVRPPAPRVHYNAASARILLSKSYPLTRFSRELREPKKE